MTELDRLYWDLEIDRYVEGHSIHTAGGHSSLYSLRVIRADLSSGNYGDEAMLRTQVVLSDEKGQTVAVTRVVPDTAYPRCALSRLDDGPRTDQLIHRIVMI